MTSINDDTFDSSFLVRPPSTEAWKDDNPCWGSSQENNLSVLLSILEKSHTILYESDDYLALDKPPDLRMDGCFRSTVHKLTAYWYPSPLLLKQHNLLRAVDCLHKHNYLRDNELHPIHQLDYPTSGVLLIGRTKKAAAVASNSFAKRQARKTYLAIVHGHLFLQEAWPVVDPARLALVMEESEQTYKKSKIPKYQQTGQTFFAGFLPPYSVFEKWQSATKERQQRLQLKPTNESESIKTIRPLKRQRRENKKRGAILEPQVFELLVEECIQLSEQAKEQLVNLKWSKVKLITEWKKAFEKLANRYNALLKEKSYTFLNPPTELLPRIFCVPGKDKEEAFYVHAACTQINGSYKMKIHPDAMPFDTSLLPTQEQLDCLDFKPALTRCVILGRGFLNGSPVTKVRLEPRTGRRHQLRLHMMVAGSPIVGDMAYVNSTRHPKNLCSRMCLHAHKLSLDLMGGPHEFVAPDPFLEILDDEGTEKKTLFHVKLPGDPITCIPAQEKKCSADEDEDNNKKRKI